MKNQLFWDGFVAATILWFVLDVAAVFGIIALLGRKK